MKNLASRPSMSSREFCEQCGLDPRHASEVDPFRRAFSSLVAIRSDQIYPDDEAPALGISYSDDLGMFLFDNHLLSNAAFRFDFPMEQASTIGEIVKLTLELNQQKNHAIHPGGGCIS